MEQLIKFYDQICGFSVDLLPEESGRLEKIGKYHIPISSDAADDSIEASVDWSFFFKHIYRKRGKLEARILEAVHRAGLACIVGPRGSGKTSAVGRVLLRTKEADKKHRLVFRFDLRKITDSDDFLVKKREFSEDSSLFMIFLRRLAINRYLSTEFSIDSTLPSGRNARYALLDFILSQNSQDFDKFRASRDDCTRLLRRFRKSRKNESATFYHWLEATSDDDDETSRLVSDIERDIELSHVVTAARKVLGMRAQIIWYDNADGLPGKTQTEIFSFLEKTFNYLAGIATCLVTIRSENIRHYDLEEQNAPSYADFVVTRANASRDLVGLDIPSFSQKFLEEIVTVRLELARDRQRRYLNALAARKSSPLPPALREELSEEEKFLGPRIQDTEFEILKRLSRNLLIRMDREKALSLCNNSLRSYLSIHSEALKRYIAVYRLMGERALNAEDWYLSTLFLRWLRRVEKNIAVGVYDIVKVVLDWERDKVNRTACCLPHLISTCVWNLQADKTLGGRPTHCPQVKEIVARLELLGFSRETIIYQMHNLHTENSGSPNILDFRTNISLETAEMIEDSHEVFLTDRGRCLCGFTCNTWGFLYESIASFSEEESPRDSSGRSLEPRPSEVSDGESLADMLPFLCKLAEMYSHGLRQVRERLKGEDKWLRTYRRLFAIPYIKQSGIYREKVGDFFGKRWRALHFEAVCSHLIAYARKHSNQDEISKLELLNQAFEDEVKRVRDGIEDEIPDFYALVGLERRETETGEIPEDLPPEGE